MSQDPEHVRRTAQEQFERNRQTEMKADYQMPDYQARETYNAELARQRAEEERRRSGQ
jgi:hypothetical protein